MALRLRIKICGITLFDDALLAVELGADALGFIFYPKSPRYLAPDAARAIIDRLPPFVTTVAVIVNETVETARQILAVSGCSMAQLHGDESPAFLRELARPAIRALSVSSVADLSALAGYDHTRAFLLDTRVAGLHGGTGQTFDWTIARDAKRFGKPIILAGGISPENVADAVRIVEPYAVDLSSSVERAPGRKDPEQLKALFAAISELRSTPTPQ